MARLGLGTDWQCAFSNEWSDKKASSYRARFGSDNLRVCDIADLTPHDLPGVPTLVWASFPCQDLSLAGGGAGLAGKRSGTFRTFWDLMRGMVAQGRIPRVIVLENVVGTLTSHGGGDFREIVEALASEGYKVGALVIDAIRFLPQSRARLFFVAIHSRIAFTSSLVLPHPSEPWHTKSLRAAVQHLPDRLRESWVWWDLAVPVGAVVPFSALIEDQPTGVKWHTSEQTERLIQLMSPIHLEKLRKAQQLPTRVVGTVYRRTRPNEDGSKSQRAEIRFDEISGCLRTPAGGSSRQTIVVVDGDELRSRLLSPREAARLMGVPDDYQLPENYNDAYHLFGDGLAVPVVRWLSTRLLMALTIQGVRVAA